MRGSNRRSEIAWRATFLGVFAVVTALTVISITGEQKHEWFYLAVSLGVTVLGFATVSLPFFRLAIAFASYHIHLPLIGNFPALWWLFSYLDGLAHLEECLEAIRGHRPASLTPSAPKRILSWRC